MLSRISDLRPSCKTATGIGFALVGITTLALAIICSVGVFGSGPAPMYAATGLTVGTIGAVLIAALLLCKCSRKTSEVKNKITQDEDVGPSKQIEEGSVINDANDAGEKTKTD